MNFYLQTGSVRITPNDWGVVQEMQRIDEVKHLYIIFIRIIFVLFVLPPADIQFL
jgi:hypothetical protein